MSSQIEKAEAKASLIETITSDVRKEWFVDYGIKNFWDEATWDKYLIALSLHNRDKEEHPELHKELPPLHDWRCWEESNCSCGFCSSCDSSD